VDSLIVEEKERRMTLNASGRKLAERRKEAVNNP
jgi:hypothetical protein